MAAAALPKRREYDVRIMRIKDNVDAASVFILRQNFGPRFPAISGTKNSAFLVWTKRMSQRRYENHVLVSRINN